MADARGVDALRQDHARNAELRPDNELSVRLLLALCVRKMELLSARWEAFDLEDGIWTLEKDDTKTKSSIRIPLAAPVVAWLEEAKVLSFGRPYVFPARRLIHRRHGEVRRNRYDHVGPDTLNVALRRPFCPPSVNRSPRTTREVAGGRRPGGGFVKAYPPLRKPP